MDLCIRKGAENQCLRKSLLSTSPKITVTYYYRWKFPASGRNRIPLSKHWRYYRWKFVVPGRYQISTLEALAILQVNFSRSGIYRIPTFEALVIFQVKISRSWQKSISRPLSIGDITGEHFSLLAENDFPHCKHWWDYRWKFPSPGREQSPPSKHL